MVLLRRRHARQTRLTQVSADSLDLDATAEKVLDAAEAALGARPDLIDGPTPVLVGAGPDAYSFSVATDDADWAGTLVARVSGESILAREATWIGELQARRFAVPELLSDRHAEGVLVFRALDSSTNLASRMATDLLSLPQLLAEFGRFHADLHALPTEGIEADDAVAAPSGRPTGFDQELSWLAKHRPTSGRSVMCHGELNPTHVYVQDGSAPVAVNWIRARLADPSFDVAATLVAFWSLPLFVDNLAQRTMLKLARDSLATAYLAAYEDAGPEPLDAPSLRYWQAFHVCGLAIDLAARGEGAPTGPWDPAANVVQPDRALQDARHHFWDLADA